jgi:hypothetical protein
MRFPNHPAFVFVSAMIILSTGSGIGAAGQQYPLPVPKGVPVISLADNPRFGTIPLTLERDRVLADEANDEQAFSRIFGMDVDAGGNLFDFKPVSFRILTDDLDRIYVQDWTPFSADNPLRRFEVYSRKGAFLFATEMPYNVGVIRAGFLYSRERDPDSGYSSIVRWRVANWKTLLVSP